MSKNDVKKLSNEIIKNIIEYYGWSKHFKTTPFLIIEDSPYSDADDTECIGEFCAMSNELIIYWKNIESEIELVKSLVHEYQHYLQSPTWMKRYYNMGYDYSNHPYEIAAYKEEDNYKIFI